MGTDGGHIGDGGGSDGGVEGGGDGSGPKYRRRICALLQYSRGFPQVRLTPHAAYWNDETQAPEVPPEHASEAQLSPLSPTMMEVPSGHVQYPPHPYIPAPVFLCT